MLRRVTRATVFGRVLGLSSTVFFLRIELLIKLEDMKKTSQAILFLVISLWFSLSSAGLLMTYHQLALKDLDQMNDLVSDKMKESKKSSSGKAVPLKEAFQAVYSRPNQDGMISKVSSPLRTQLERLDSFERVVTQLVDEALHALKNSKNFKPDVQVTYAFFLENLVAEFRPFLRDNGFERKMIEKIAKSDVQLTKEALKERKTRLMVEGESPSLLASEVLKAANTAAVEDERAEKADAEKAAKSKKTKEGSSSGTSSQQGEDAGDSED